MEDANLIWGKSEGARRIGVILPAGGKGLRVGCAVPKQFVSLSEVVNANESIRAGHSLPPGNTEKEVGRPMLLYALETFHRLD